MLTWHTNTDWVFVCAYLGLLQDGLGLGLLLRHHWSFLGIASILELGIWKEEDSVPPVMDFPNVREVQAHSPPLWPCRYVTLGKCTASSVHVYACVSVCAWTSMIVLRVCLTGSINTVPGGPGIPSAPGRPGRPGGPWVDRTRIEDKNWLLCVWFICLSLCVRATERKRESVGGGLSREKKRPGI